MVVSSVSARLSSPAPSPASFMVVISVSYLFVPFASREGCRVSLLGGTVCGLLQTPSLVSTYLMKEYKNSQQTTLTTH